MRKVVKRLNKCIPDDTLNNVKIVNTIKLKYCKIKIEIRNLKKYRMINPEKIATCMLLLANGTKKYSIISSDEIERIYEQRSTK